MKEVGIGNQKMYFVESIGWVWGWGYSLGD